MKEQRFGIYCLPKGVVFCGGKEGVKHASKLFGSWLMYGEMLNHIKKYYKLIPADCGLGAGH